MDQPALMGLLAKQQICKWNSRNYTNGTAENVPITSRKEWGTENETVENTRDLKGHQLTNYPIIKLTNVLSGYQQKNHTAPIN